jgi:hypothetical protein
MKKISIFRAQPETLQGLVILKHSVTKAAEKSFRGYQGCQIFLDAMYQNREKYTKLPNVHKIY